MMESSNSGKPGGKRSREREREVPQLSDIEQKKRQKNRDAAKKCRQNKQMEMENLKKNNESLEAKNAELLMKKADLEGKVKNLLQFIHEHLSQGCQLPPQEAEVWSETWQSLCQMLPVTRTNESAQIAMMVPESPEPSTSPAPNVSSSRTAQLVQPSPTSPSLNGNGQYMSTCASPMSLFSGVPMSTDQVTPRQSYAVPSPSQQSSSPSPSLSTLSSTPPYQRNGSPVSPVIPLETPMYQGIARDGISSSTAMIHHHNEINVQTVPYMESQISTDSSASSIPLVVLEESIDDPDQDLDQNKTQTSDVLRQVREEPEMEVENVFQRYGASYGNNTVTSMEAKSSVHVGMESTNLGSGGFTFRQDSCPKPQHNVAFQEVPQTPDHFYDKGKLRGKRKQEEATHTLNLTAPDLVAQAVLNIRDGEMTTTLKQQIHSITQSTETSDATPESCDNTINPSGNQTCYPSNSSAYSSSHLPQPQQTLEPTSLEERGQQQEAMSPNVQRQHKVGQNSFVTTLRVQLPNGEIVPHEFANMKYVEKCGHHFVLEQKPEGMYRVYELKGDVLIDTQHELQLKDGPPTPQPTSSKTTSLAVPTPSGKQAETTDPTALAHGENSNVLTYTQMENLDTYSNVPSFTRTSSHEENTLSSFKQNKRRGDNSGDSSENMSCQVSEKGVSESSLPSGILNLPSLSFNDLNQEEYNVFAKKARGKDVAT